MVRKYFRSLLEAWLKMKRSRSPKTIYADAGEDELVPVVVSGVQGPYLWDGTEFPPRKYLPLPECEEIRRGYDIQKNAIAYQRQLAEAEAVEERRTKERQKQTKEDDVKKNKKNSGRLLESAIRDKVRRDKEREERERNARQSQTKCATLEKSKIQELLDEDDHERSRVAFVKDDV